MIHFEVYVKQTPAYVSLGFSEDKIMVWTVSIVLIFDTYCVRPLIVISLSPLVLRCDVITERVRACWLPGQRQ